MSISTVDESGAYHINDIIPPDEFVDHVNDSVYTNYVASAALRIAADAAQLLNVTSDTTAAYRAVADSLVLLFDPAQGIHPEYAGYAGDTVKQADTILLSYPLGLALSDDVHRADLDYYASRTALDGPAMTWGMFSIGYLDLGEFDLAASYFNQSFANVKTPFQVWSETVSNNFATSFIIPYDII